MTAKRTTFELASGRIIDLLALDQHYTYEGLLAGIPTREMNQDMMDRLIAVYVRPAEYGVPLLLEPEQQPLDVPEHRHVDGTPATLPSVTCIARFNSDGQLGTDDIWSVLRRAGGRVRLDRVELVPTVTLRQIQEKCCDGSPRTRHGPGPKCRCPRWFEPHVHVVRHGRVDGRMNGRVAVGA